MSDHAQLGDRGFVRGTQKLAIDAGGFEPRAQFIGGIVGADDADEGGGAAERGDIQGHVAGAARSVLALADAHDGHGRLGRNSRSLAMPVPVEHDIAGHEQTGVLEGGHRGLHGLLAHAEEAKRIIT